MPSSDGGIPCVWQQDPQGAWTRQPIGDLGAMVPRAVNNLGTVVGTRYATDGSAHATIWTKAEGCRDIPKPKGFVRSEANAINNHGAIVGTVDGSHDSDLGPSAFVYESGVTRLLQEGGPNFSVATTINDEGQVAGTFEVPEVKEQPEPQKAQPKP